MDWIIALLALMVSCLLVLQGVLFLRHESGHAYLRWMGFQTLLLAGLGLISYGLTASGTLIFAREFGEVLVQGRLAYLGLSVLLVGIPFCAGLGLHLARVDVGFKTSGRGILFAGAVLGALAVWRIKTLNPHDPAPLCVRVYDFWWPPLALWVCACLLQCVLLLARKGMLPTAASEIDSAPSPALHPSGEGIHSHKTGEDSSKWGALKKLPWNLLVAHLFPPAGLAILAIYQAQMGIEYFDNPWTLGMWKVCLLLTLPSLVGRGAWLIITRIRKVTKPAESLLDEVVIGGLVAVVTVSTALWMQQEKIIVFSLFRPLIIYLVCLSIPVLYAGFRLEKTFASGTFRMPDFGLHRRNDLVWMAVFLSLILWMLADLIYFELINPVFDLTILMLAWIAFAEVTTGGQLLVMVRAAGGEGAAEIQSPLRHALKQGRELAVGSLSSFGKWLKGVFKADNTAMAVLKVFLGIVLLIALSEIPNAGKTIIHQFSVPIPGLSDDDEKKLGSLIAARVLNTLGGLKRDLRPDEVTLTPGSMGEAESHFVPITDSALDLDTTLSKSSDIKIGPVEIPLGMIYDLIRSPTRSFLNARSINGTLHAESNGFSLLAYSSSGENWKVSSSLAAREQATPELADKLAFQIITSDPGLSLVGMTRSAGAFDAFRCGLDAWKRFDRGDFDSLKEAIEDFRAATKEDDKFALAYYRLGLALRADRQPAAAVEALRSSIGVGHNFVPGHIALAYTLRDFDNYYPSTAAALNPVPLSGPDASQSCQNEVRRLLQNVLLFPRSAVSLNDRASAYYGLCSVTPTRLQQPCGPSLRPCDKDLNTLAYFYCKRAEQSYAKLPGSLQNELQIRETRAEALNTVAVTLLQRKITFRADPSLKWSCSASTVSWNDRSEHKLTPQYDRPESPYSSAALRYFERALTFAPDDLVIRCNAAIASLAREDPRRMIELQGEAAAHIQLGETFSELARGDSRLDAAPYYLLALNEYDQAIKLVPYNVDALNGYAYTFWVWRYYSPKEKPPDGPGPEIAHQAEKRARYAARLVTAGKAPIVTEVMVRSTLGEVLLGQGRSEEAAEVLSKVEAPLASQFDEIRWDLAQADLCQSSNDQRAGHKSEAEDSLNKASHILVEIQKNEEGREYQPFTLQPQKLNPSHVQVACMWRPEVKIEIEPGPNTPVYKLRGGKPTYDRFTTCDGMDVVADAFDEGGKPVQNLFLHVWGGGVDSTIPVGEPGQGRQDIYLLSEPRDTLDYYFAQLEDSEGKPVSSVDPIQTFANKPGSPCSQNEITLTYVREASPIRGTQR